MNVLTISATHNIHFNARCREKRIVIFAAWWYQKIFCQKQSYKWQFCPPMLTLITGYLPSPPMSPGKKWHPNNSSQARYLNVKNEKILYLCIPPSPHVTISHHFGDPLLRQRPFSIFGRIHHSPGYKWTSLCWVVTNKESLSKNVGQVKSYSTK